MGGVPWICCNDSALSWSCLDLMLPGLHGLELFRLLHPALVVSETSNHSKEQKPAILSRCLQMAIESETYE